MSKKDESFDPKGKPNYLRILVFLGISGVLALIMLDKIRPHDATDIEVTSESDRHLTDLKDGSKVWMREGTVLIYPDEFDPKERSVRILGEARVEGVFKEDVPFSLQISKYALTGAGYEVHIINPDTAPSMRFHLLKGPALLKGLTIDSQLISEGDWVVVDKESGAVSFLEEPEGPDNSLSWQQNELHFLQTPLPNVLSDLENHFQVRLETDLPPSDSCFFSGDFPKPKLDKLLSELETSLGIESEGTGQAAYLLRLSECAGN